MLDLGCGAKDLLKYITPKKYVGIDYYTNEYADIKIDFNSDFELPDSAWDYIVCSGLVEYLSDLDHFFSCISFKAKKVIVTFWTGAKAGIDNPNCVETLDEFDRLFQKYFKVIKVDKWDQHYIYLGMSE